VDIPEGVKVITVCDGEGDMYELFTKAQSLNESLLIRIVWNRMTAENVEILDEIRKKRWQGRVEVTLPQDSLSSIPERETVLQQRHALYQVKRSHIRNPMRILPDSIDLYRIYVKEARAAKGKKPIEWFHYVLKSRA
jgi:hypothetical protein